MSSKSCSPKLTHSLKSLDRLPRRKCRRARSGVSSFVLLLVLGIVIAAGVILYLNPFGGGEQNKELITYTVRRDDLVVTVLEQGTLESSDNTEIKCQVRGQNTITWVIESGTIVEDGNKNWLWDNTVLVRLDTLAIEEAITERKKFALLTRASAERLEAAKESAALAVKEYELGTFVNELMQLEKDLVVARSNLKAAENVLRHERRLALRGFSNDRKIAQNKIRVQQYNNQVEKLSRDISELKKYTREKQLATLRGDSKAAIANFNAEAERAIADENRKEQAIDELKHCIVPAPRSGLVIHPSAAQWEGAPDIEEGATVHKTQVMLLMPDLNKMQIKVGIHESIVSRVKKGMKALVILNDRELECEVLSVARITKPAGWWTGNVVKYDTIIKLPEDEPGLKPGMSAEVQIILAKYEDIVTVPVAAVLQTPSGSFCWVKAHGKVKRRLLEIGDSNDVFIQVKSGLEEGDEVVLDPLSYIDEAEAEALLPKKEEDELGSSPAESQPTESSGSSP